LISVVIHIGAGNGRSTPTRRKGLPISDWSVNAPAFRTVAFPLRLHSAHFRVFRESLRQFRRPFVPLPPFAFLQNASFLPLTVVPVVCRLSDTALLSLLLLRLPLFLAPFDRSPFPSPVEIRPNTAWRMWAMLGCIGSQKGFRIGWGWQCAEPRMRRF
jgi:hypothetical protein